MHRLLRYKVYRLSRYEVYLEKKVPVPGRGMRPSAAAASNRPGEVSVGSDAVTASCESSLSAVSRDSTATAPASADAGAQRKCVPGCSTGACMQQPQSTKIIR